MVAKGYRPVDRDQQFLMPPDMREWLSADHPVWLVIAAVGQLDTSAVHAHRRTGGVGRAGYHPDMLLTLLMWAWAQGVRSSRRIERACEQDVAFRVICAGDVPDHVTISRFRAESAAAMESVFEQVLILCAKLGMARLGVVALDGVKIGSNASMSANRTEEGLVKAGQDERDRQAAAVAARAAARAAAAEHAAADAAEDDLFGPDDRGDQVPPDAVACPLTRQNVPSRHGEYRGRSDISWDYPAMGQVPAASSSLQRSATRVSFSQWAVTMTPNSFASLRVR